MKMVSKMFWAVAAAAVIMVINPTSASAQVPNTPSGGQCVAVDTAVSTIASLCAMPAYAGCPRCAQMRPCLGPGCGGPSTITPPAPTSTPVDGWATARRECKGEPVSEPGESDGACVCNNKHYKPVPIRRSSTVVGNTPTGGKLRRLTEVWFCFPVDRNEDAIKQLTEQMSTFELWKKENEANIASIPDLRRRVEELEKNLRATWQLALNANTTAARLEQDVNAVAEAFALLQTEVRAVGRFVPKMDLGYSLGVMFRGSDAGSGMTHHLVLGFTQNFEESPVQLWAQGRIGYLTCDGCDPATADSATMYTGGAAAGVGVGLGETRDFSLRGGMYFQLIAPPDSLPQNGMGRQIGIEAQVRYDIPGVPLYVAGVGDLGVYNYQNYFGAAGDPPANVYAGLDTSMGGALMLQIGFSPKLSFLY